MTNDLAADIFDGSMSLTFSTKDEKEPVITRILENSVAAEIEEIKMEKQAAEDLVNLIAEEKVPEDKDETDSLFGMVVEKVAEEKQEKGDDGLDLIDDLLSESPASINSNAGDGAMVIPLPSNEQIESSLSGKVSAKSLLISVQGGAKYLGAQARVLLFRQEYGADWGIHTFIEEYERDRLEMIDGKPHKINGFATVRCEIVRPDGKVVAIARKSWTAAKNPRLAEFVLEAAETGAVGRAIAMMGIGTLAALNDFSEGRMTEAPQRG